MLPLGSFRKIFPIPFGSILPIVLSCSKFTAYNIPDLSTAGPSTPEVKLLRGVKTADLNNSPAPGFCAIAVKDIPEIKIIKQYLFKVVIYRFLIFIIQKNKTISIHKF